MIINYTFRREVVQSHNLSRIVACEVEQSHRLRSFERWKVIPFVSHFVPQDSKQHYLTARLHHLLESSAISRQYCSACYEVVQSHEQNGMERGKVMQSCGKFALLANKW